MARLAALALAATPAGAQGAREIVQDAVRCGGSAVALKLLRRGEVRDGVRSSEPKEAAAVRARLAIGLHAAWATRCGMGQPTYEIGSTLAGHVRLDEVAEAAPDGIGLAAEMRVLEEEVDACLDARGGADLLSIADDMDENGRIGPCGWR